MFTQEPEMAANPRSQFAGLTEKVTTTGLGGAGGNKSRKRVKICCNK
jgi:hypothetical protein